MSPNIEGRRGKLLLADGSRFDGYLVGPGGTVACGEVVFNTSMTGYQEVITDPSYAGQVVVMTYPQIGNYGVSAQDSESERCAARALVVRELSPYFSPGPGRSSLLDFLREKGVPCLWGIDTRALTRRIRSAGCVIGVIAGSETRDEELLGIASRRTFSRGESLVESVTRARRPYRAGPLAGGACGESGPLPGLRPGEVRRASLRAAVVDLGVKNSIVSRLVSLGVEPVLLPADFSAAEVLSGEFDLAVLSNGPGDPADVPAVTSQVRLLLGNIPVLGVCLGFQILALAMGAKTYKMKFGHRGANQPVVCLRTGRVYITSQNHGYAVPGDFEAQTGAWKLKLTYVNANDGTVEGFCDESARIEGVQFHPEAAPGPNDTVSIFEDFLHRMDGRRNAEAA